MGPWLGAMFPGGSGLTAPDFAVFAVLLAAMTWLGWRAGDGMSTDDEYRLAARGEHWILAALALVAAEVSVLTVMGVPAQAFREDWGYLQLFLGAALGRAAVAAVLLPAFFAAGAETPYAYLGRRFGPRTRAAAAAAFVITRALATAVRLLAACVAAAVLLGWSPWPTLALFTVVAAAALARGGARAAVRAGAFQTLVVLGVGVLSVLFLLKRTDGGIGAAWSLADEARKFRVLGGPGPFLAAVITGFFGSAAAFGTDHELTQKVLVVPDARRARAALLLSIAGSFAVLFVYLLVGTMLFVYYKQNPGMALPAQPDMLLPHFADAMMGRGMRGLVLGALALSSVDAPLASLASSWTADLLGPAASPEAGLRRARATAVVFALALAALAGAFAASDEALSLAFKAAAVASGPLLGLFALGVWTEGGGDGAALASFLAMAAANLAVLAAAERGALALSWGWLLPLGALGTFGAGRLLARRGL